MGGPSLLFHFPRSLPQLPRSSHHIRAATFRSLGPGCPWCTLLALKSIVCSPSALSWDPSPGQLPSESISAPLPLPARSPHVWCVHISKTRRVQKEWGRKKKKNERAAQLLAALRVHVAQASAPLSWDWMSGAGGGAHVISSPPPPGSYKYGLQPSPVLSASPCSRDSRISLCSAR